jgi:hypothetical protein
MNATILLRIMPDPRSKYALLVDGQELGEVATLSDAVLVRECLKEHDFTVDQARAILEAVELGPQNGR